MPDNAAYPKEGGEQKCSDACLTNFICIYYETLQAFMKGEG